MTVSFLTLPIKEVTKFSDVRRFSVLTEEIFGDGTASRTVQPSGDQNGACLPFLDFGSTTPSFSSANPYDTLVPTPVEDNGSPGRVIVTLPRQQEAGGDGPHITSGYHHTVPASIPHTPAQILHAHHHAAAHGVAIPVARMQITPYQLAHHATPTPEFIQGRSSAPIASSDGEQPRPPRKNGGNGKGINRPRGIPRYHCMSCTREPFHCKSSLARHEKEDHGELRYKCIAPKCPGRGKLYTSKSSFLRHFEGARHKRCRKFVIRRYNWKDVNGAWKPKDQDKSWKDFLVYGGSS